MRVLALAMLLFASAVQPQTPAQMQYEQQQREYRQQMERQQQEQQRQQQIMQENARRQQEELNRLNRPQPAPNYGTPAPTTTPSYGSQATRPSQQSSGGSTSSALPTGPAPAAPPPPKAWVQIYTSPSATLYADLTSVKRVRSNRLMSNIRNYKTYQAKLGKSFLSSRETFEHDCDNQRSKARGWRYYSQHNAQGIMVDYSSPDQLSDHWYVPTDFGGLIGQMLKLACKE